MSESELPAPSRAESIAETLRAQILAGKYEPGERLPSERELSERLSVNRSSVREALKKLEQLGMIAIRPGGGARVVPIEQAGLGVLQHALSAQVPSRELVSQWLDVWEIVLVGATRLAMERGDDAGFDEAKRLLKKLCATSTTADEFVEISDQLTELVARASRNFVLGMVRNGLTATAHKRIGVRKHLHASRKKLLPFTRDIERAMDSRDPALAEDAVRRLLRRNREDVLDFVAGPKASTEA